MAHSVSPANRDAATGTEEPSVGALVQSAMADMSTLVRAEIELAKAEVGKSAKKAGIGGGLFGAAAVVAGFSMFFVFIALAEGLTAIGLPRWLSYLLVWVFLLLLAGLLYGFVLDPAYVAVGLLVGAGALMIVGGLAAGRRSRR